MNKILVTGGAGFIGSHVAKYLLAHGENVTIFDDLSGGFVENLPYGANFIRGSIEDKTLVNYIFREEKFDFVFHLAAYAAENLSHFIKRFNYQNNLIGSINLINASIINDVRCFVYTSSIAVYGSPLVQPVNEVTLAVPEDSYGISKLAVEQELRICKEMFDLNSVIFRPHNVFGEHQNIGDKYRNVIGIFMNQLVQDKPMTIFGDGEQTRNFTYVHNIVPTICNSIYKDQTYNNTFNIGDDVSLTINELASCVAFVMKKDCMKEYLPSRKEVKHIVPSHNKIEQFFGDTSQYNFEQGLANMAEWVRKNGSRTAKKFSEIEIERNLPPSWR